MGLSENKVSQNQTKFYDHNFPIIFRVRIAIDLLDFQAHQILYMMWVARGGEGNHIQEPTADSCKK